MSQRISEALKEAKEEYKAATRRNVEIKLAPYVVNEMNRFESEIGRIQIEDATAISNAGLYGLADVSLKDLKADMKAAKALPSNTDEEKELRKYKINFCRTRITAKTYYNKYYGAGNAFETPDDTVLNELYNKEARYDEKEDILYKKLFEAEENKDKHEIANIKRQIKELKEKFKKLNKQINEEQNRRLSYTRSAKPLLDANKILRQAENYTHFEEIKERYEEAKRNLDLAEAEVEAEAEA